MSGEEKYIFIFTITPVQSFIAQARKTRDLFAGSQILSELTKEAIRLTEEYENTEIIIPNVDIEKAHSISNKFVAIFKDIEEENLEIIGKNIEFKTLLYWKKEIANKTLENTRKQLKGNSTEYSQFLLKFNDHITKYFNIYWLFYPIENRSYEETYREAEKHLRAIKNVRCFEQFETEENHRKCSICGERDAIVYKQGSNPAYKYKNSLDLEINLIEENEGLCGVCFVKRFYEFKEKKEYFPSTAKISLLNLFNNNELGNKISSYKGKFGECWNDQFLFEENLRNPYLKKQGCETENLDLTEIKKDLRDIYDLAKKKDLKITKYYALIKFDGDNMGKWLSGTYFEDKNKDKDKLKEFHKELSKKLREFAEYSKNYLDNKRGKTVYAGGDDFLGFINLEYLFEVLENLRKEFDEKVNKPLENEFKFEKDLTFSAGVVIAHYKDPLSLVLDWVDKLEEEAKSLDDKNAFGIAVLKRSGEIKKAVFKWDKLEYIREIYQSVVERKEFNSSFIVKLEESFRKIFIDFYLYEEKKQLDKIKEEIELEEEQNLILVEIRRVLKRSSNIKNKNEKEGKINLMKNWLNKLIDYENYDIQNFFGILNIILFLEREL